MQIRLEGSAEELVEVLRALPRSATLETSAVELVGEMAPSGPVSEPAEGEPRFVTSVFACRTLKRLRLSTPMKKVLVALYEAHPRWLSLPALHRVSGYRPSQFAGLMGAFGRRIANTDGFDADAHFFEYRWNDEEETWDYRLPDSVCGALELEKLV